MKTLSIKNPWAWLIAKGFKDIENRSWKTKFRGTFLIHSTQKWDQRASEMSLLLTRDQWDELDENIHDRVFLQTNIPTSAIIGQVDLVDCVQNSKSIWAEEGQWHWVLDNAIYYDNYIPDVKGKLSFWEFNNSLEQRASQ